LRLQRLQLQTSPAAARGLPSIRHQEARIKENIARKYSISTICRMISHGLFNAVVNISTIYSVWMSYSCCCFHDRILTNLPVFLSGWWRSVSSYEYGNAFSLHEFFLSFVIYTVGHKKTCHFYFYDNFGKCGPISI